MSSLKFPRNGDVPRQVLFSAEVRALKTPEEKAAFIMFNYKGYCLSRLCTSLKADYQRTRRRYLALKDGLEWHGVGRPPLVDKSALDETKDLVSKQFKISDPADYEDIRQTLENQYRQKLAAMTSETRQKYPSNLRKNYVYELSKKYEFNTKVPTEAEKNRNECSTSETVNYFFNNTFTPDLIEGVPPELFINADETSVEVGLPRKVILPPGETRADKVDKFGITSHISAMVTINATGDDFTPYLITPLKRLPKDILKLVTSGKINIGGSKNGWMDDECFAEWASWLISRVSEIREIYGYDPNTRAILLLDGHGSRNNSAVMRSFKKANIDVVIFPPHMTHIMQPFDRVIARPLKDCLGRIARAMISVIPENEQNSVPTIRLVQVRSLIDACRVATTVHNCQTAFSECGLFPYDPSKIFGNKQVRKSKQNFIQTETMAGPSFKISGRCITSADVLECLKTKSPKTKKESPKSMK